MSTTVAPLLLLPTCSRHQWVVLDIHGRAWDHLVAPVDTLAGALVPGPAIRGGPRIRLGEKAAGRRVMSVALRPLQRSRVFLLDSQ
jgi:hypothetical protein